LRVLVSGGYGNFGARICRALATQAHIELLIAGRDGAQAQRFARNLGGHARGIALDVSSGLADALRAQHVDLLIHTAGPFQTQGYAVAAAAAAAGAHYIDLSHGRRFVCDFPAALNGAFQSAGRTAISGASTVPALSSAVVNHLCHHWQRIDDIDLCIAPAQSAPRGAATIAAVLSYCGEPIRVWDEGRWQVRRGWAKPGLVHFARMRPRIGALCDIPDLELFPAHFNVTQRVMFRAALEVRLTQRGFAALAAARAAGVIPNPSCLARPITALSPLFDRFGTQLGGMVVRVAGIDATGRIARRAWHIAADDDHGPEIPCMAAIALTLQLVKAAPLPVGAHTAMGLLPLSAFEPQFARWGMVTDVVEE
jgi:NAD(P)-dependent dehydrogenase (short-subunit alcohol dehydrogenase family)